MGGCLFRVVLFRQGAVSQRQGDSRGSGTLSAFIWAWVPAFQGIPAATI